MFSLFSPGVTNQKEKSFFATGIRLPAPAENRDKYPKKNSIDDVISFRHTKQNKKKLPLSFFNCHLLVSRNQMNHTIPRNNLNSQPQQRVENILCFLNKYITFHLINSVLGELDKS